MLLTSPSTVLWLERDLNSKKVSLWHSSGKVSLPSSFAGVCGTQHPFPPHPPFFPMLLHFMLYWRPVLTLLPSPLPLQKWGNFVGRTSLIHPCHSNGKGHRGELLSLCTGERLSCMLFCTFLHRAQKLEQHASTVLSAVLITLSCLDHN